MTVAYRVCHNSQRRIILLFLPLCVVISVCSGIKQLHKAFIPSFPWILFLWRVNLKDILERIGNDFRERELLILIGKEIRVLINATDVSLFLIINCSRRLKEFKMNCIKSIRNEWIKFTVKYFLRLHYVIIWENKTVLVFPVQVMVS